MAWNVILCSISYITQFQITDFFQLFSVRFCTVRLGYVLSILKIGSIVVSFSWGADNLREDILGFLPNR